MRAAFVLAALIALAGCGNPRCLGTSHTEPEVTEDPMVIARILDENRERLAPIIDDPRGHRVQILLSEVVAGPDGAPTLRRSGYRVDEEYFYPASTVKTAAAIAAMQELDELRLKGWDVGLDTPLVYHPLFDDEVLEDADESNIDSGRITIGHEIRKLAIVSDNLAFNRLYEFVGPRRLNETLWAAGPRHARTVHRLSEFRTREQNRRSPRIDMMTPDGVRTLPERVDAIDLSNEGMAGLLIGEAHMVGGDRIDGPMDFTSKNAFPLQDLQDLLVLLVRPDIDLAMPGLGLSDTDRAFLVQAMSEYPRQSRNPVFDPKDYPDQWPKNFLPGLRRVVAQEELLYVNKTGRAYGFTLDNAYIEHTPTGRAFFLTVAIYTNPNGTVNDGAYGYRELADPFFENLGEAVARDLWAVSPDV